MSERGVSCVKYVRYQWSIDRFIRFYRIPPPPPLPTLYYSGYWRGLRSTCVLSKIAFLFVICQCEEILEIPVGMVRVNGAWKVVESNHNIINYWSLLAKTPLCYDILFRLRMIKILCPALITCLPTPTLISETGPSTKHIFLHTPFGLMAQEVRATGAGYFSCYRVFLFWAVFYTVFGQGRKGHFNKSECKNLMSFNLSFKIYFFIEFHWEFQNLRLYCKDCNGGNGMRVFFHVTRWVSICLPIYLSHHSKIKLDEWQLLI